MALTFYKVLDGITGDFGSFAPDDILGMDGPLPVSLKGVCVPWLYDPPPTFITVDLARFAERAKPRPEPPPVVPLTEQDVRKQYRLLDPEAWVLACQCNFPRPALKRSLTDREGRSSVIDLWLEPDITNWLERFSRLATLLVRR